MTGPGLAYRRTQGSPQDFRIAVHDVAQPAQALVAEYTCEPSERIDTIIQTQLYPDGRDNAQQGFGCGP